MAPAADEHRARLEDAFESAGFRVDRKKRHSNLFFGAESVVRRNSFCVSLFKGGRFHVSMTPDAASLIAAELGEGGEVRTWGANGGRHKRFLFTETMSCADQASLVKAVLGNASAESSPPVQPRWSDRDRAMAERAQLQAAFAACPDATVDPHTGHVNILFPGETKYTCLVRLVLVHDVGRVRGRVCLGKDRSGRHIEDALARALDASRVAYTIGDVPEDNHFQIRHTRVLTSEAPAGTLVSCVAAAHAAMRELEGAARAPPSGRAQRRQPPPTRSAAVALGAKRPVASSSSSGACKRSTAKARDRLTPEAQERADEASGDGEVVAVAVAETDDRDCPLVCPIEQDGHMKEPVTLPCGCNFERRAITAWLGRHGTCPTCREQGPFMCNGAVGIRGILWVDQSIDLWLVSRPTEGAMKAPLAAPPSGATSGAATDQLAAPAPGKKRKRVDFNPAAKAMFLASLPTYRAKDEGTRWGFCKQIFDTHGEAKKQGR
ncbi:hypothetical protein EMIHUDRAFT_203126 [Emiliania huxleyi CCMP1516]|uniref:U-box domain-containing protein n=2 Tax=Emiliania huxleyi TaxID=2903 RepID=A0A0D3K5L1_EMIH1|nr:hypothetical protein EMIHUDRAFT_203126 [Emiliania huxleyi CCMP1516]EOD31046.1 hypothetical protein EMIHUDRAFT_203126 [Emiliania huxleyi CCMP1516]|eukprot:XP_005783475.1 hypothetical protein EMIHUDRAFT_203126 [Emiliania huxleyi CCMP1516]